MRAGWKVRGDEIIGPSGRTVAVVIPDLPFLVRKDLIERIEDAPRKAAAKARAECETREEYEPPEDY